MLAQLSKVTAVVIKKLFESHQFFSKFYILLAVQLTLCFKSEVILMCLFFIRSKSLSNPVFLKTLCFSIMSRQYQNPAHTNIVPGLHHRLTIFLMCICVYSTIITVFYFKNPVQKFRYLSVHIKSKHCAAS